MRRFELVRMSRGDGVNSHFKIRGCLCHCRACQSLYVICDKTQMYKLGGGQECIPSADIVGWHSA
jgi:hypothetical protein